MFRTFLIGCVFIVSACGNEQAADMPVVDTQVTEVVAEAPVVSASVSSVEVERGVNPGEFQLSWQTEPASAKVRIEVSTNPAFVPGEGELVGEYSNSQSVTWNDQQAATRQYFAFIPENGSPVKAAVRLLPLEGGRNFRDMGGYETVDGKHVKWGHIFRSGVMHNLTDTDYEYLSQLGVKTICDYRAADEREQEPTDWRAGEINYMFFPDPDSVANRDENPMFAALLDPESTPADVQKSMADGYSRIAYDQAPAYTAMFDQLASGNIPLTFNCSAGKDRAGTSAALILTALGVPREMVVHDYSLSDDYVDYMAEYMSDEARREAAEGDSPYAFIFELPREKVAPLMASHPEYIEGTFAALEEKHGSVMAFIQNELDVTDEELAAIRQSLLE